ncbi:putative thioredoxin [Naematelia encephala]|uniref:Putative thioredoxin n=1 Tax=Naematelia encephala TaxID=71784 RepID=A0A1Y2B011_9TREE|nr:putative thioredoxin [Naematelia encephala]
MSRLSSITRGIPSGSRMTRRYFSSSRVARDHILNTDAAGFRARALDETQSKPVLVDFFATWCQPCRMLTPTLKNLTGPESQYDLITIDVDEHPEVAGQYKVSALPTVVAFKNGKPVNKFVGMLREEQVKTFLGKL